MIRLDEATLEAAFLARRCLVCGAPAVAVRPGQDAVYQSVTIGTVHGMRTHRRQIQREINDLNLCRRHAAFTWRQGRCS